MGFFDGLMSFAGSMMDEAKVAQELSGYFSSLSNKELKDVATGKISPYGLEPCREYCGSHPTPSVNACKAAARIVGQRRGICN